MNSETQHFTMQASFSEEGWEPLSLLNPPRDAFFFLQSGHRFGCFFYICLWVSLCSYSCANQQKHELCHYALVSTSIRISSGQLTIFPTRRKKPLVCILYHPRNSRSVLLPSLFPTQSHSSLRLLITCPLILLYFS